MTYKQLKTDDDFERWWNIYPRKVAKGDARKAWFQTAGIRPPIEKLIKSVIVAKSSDQWIKDGGQFIPYPATYLRQERWEDVHEIELEGVINGQMWWETVGGVNKKAGELGLREEDFLCRADFRNAVFKAAGHNVTELKPGPGKKLCAYCEKVATGMVSGIWYCPSHSRDAMDGVPVPHMRGVVAKAVAGE